MVLPGFAGDSPLVIRMIAPGVAGLTGQFDDDRDKDRDNDCSTTIEKMIETRMRKEANHCHSFVSESSR